MTLAILTGVIGLIGIIVLRATESDGADKAAEASGLVGIAPQTELEPEDWDRLAEAGTDVVRVQLNWENVQHVEGDCKPESQVNACQWVDFDEIVGAASVHGIRVLPVLGGRPEFAHDDDSAEHLREHPPTEGEAFERWLDFAGAAAARYGPGGEFWAAYDAFTGAPALPIEEWQIWNEPNAVAFWPPEPDADAYAKLVVETAEVIRESDPSAEIVLAGMFGTAAERSDDFLAQLYETPGFEDSYDSLAVHPYSPDLRGIEAQIGWLRDAAAEQGDPDVGLWVTELGWGSADGGHPLEVGEAGQAELLRESFEYLLENREELNVEGVTWFTWEDDSTEGVCRFCRNAGLFDDDGEPKPAWDAYREFAAGAAG